MAQAAPRRHPAVGDPAVPGQRVRGVLDAAVRRAGAARRAARGGPARRGLDVPDLLVRRASRSCARPRRCSALLTFMERWNDFLWPYLVLDPDHPDRAGRAVAAVRRLLHRPGAGHGRHAARRRCRCSWSSSSSAARSSAASCRAGSSRDHGRARPPRWRRPSASRGVPGRLRLGRRHRGVPDRGRRHRGRPRALDLGHLRATPPAGSATATPATWPSTTTTGTPRTST